MKKLFLLLFFALSACAPIIPPNTGVEGQVLIGPQCPAMQVGEPCPDLPYQATLTINKPNGKRVTEITTDENGRFRTSLAAGEYILHPESINLIPYAQDQTFVVVEGVFTLLTVNYDNGVR